MRRQLEARGRQAGAAEVPGGWLPYLGAAWGPPRLSRGRLARRLLWGTIVYLAFAPCMQHFLLQVKPYSPSGSAFRGSRFRLHVPARFQVPGSWGVRNTAWDRGGGMRHRGAKCACRVDPSTSGGAAESTSSMYACYPPEGPSAVDRCANDRRKTAFAHHLANAIPFSFYPHSYLFDEAVACLMGRLLPAQTGNRRKEVTAS